MPMPRDDLRPVDALEVLVLVDNVLDVLSTTPDSVTSEIPNIRKAGAKELGGKCLCCGAWGLSLAITTVVDGERRSLLFDSGPEAYALERNARRLGLDWATIDCAVVSHGHFDHAGGMPKALQLASTGNGGRKIPVHVNPGMFPRRGVVMSEEGDVFPLGDVPSPQELTAAGGEVISSDDSRTVLEGTVLVSGEIPRVTDYEHGLPKQVRRDEAGNWVPDPLVLDERYLSVDVKDYGIVVFSACSHAGIVNVLTDAAGTFGTDHLYAVMGGLHLSGPGHEPLIGRTVADIGRFGLERIVPGHCTGWRATHALVNAYGDTVVPEAVGQTHRFGTDS